MVSHKTLQRQASLFLSACGRNSEVSRPQRQGSAGRISDTVLLVSHGQGILACSLKQKAGLSSLCGALDLSRPAYFQGTFYRTCVSNSYVTVRLNFSKSGNQLKLLCNRCHSIYRQKITL